MTAERMPLFPLNTVLMPGMVLPLRIFEPRYQVMMQRVLAGERRFGVLLIRRGCEVDPDAEPYDVGTIAEVTSVAPVEGGLINISTVGSRRFRVQAFHRDQPYLTGDVEYLSEEYQPSAALSTLRADVDRLCVQYVTTVLALHDEQVEHICLPDDSVMLSYKIAGLLMAIRPEEAQTLLESQSLEHRLHREIALLRREVAILRRMGEMGDPGERISPN